MQTIKTIVVVFVLLGVGYGVYVILNKPPGELPPEVAGQTEEDWQVNVDMGDMPPVGAPSPGQPTTSPGQFAAVSPPAALGGPDQMQSPAAVDRQMPSGFEGQAVSTEVPVMPPVGGSDQFGIEPPAEVAGPSTPISSGYPSGAVAVRTTPFDTTWSSVVRSLEGGDLAVALFTLTPLYERDNLTSSQRQQVLALMDQLAGTTIYSRDHHLEPAYTVQRGDTLDTIAQQYQVSTEFLARVNGIDTPDTLVPGEQLKVVRGPFTAELYRDRGELVIYLQRYYAGRFLVTLGPDSPSGGASLTVASKQPGRVYYDSQGVEVMPSDPRNPYGQHWIGLGGNVGIHGMSLTEGGSPRGSIALMPGDATDAFALLTLDSRVTVR